MFSAYIDGLRDLDESDVLEACRRWPTLVDRGKWWPALEELRGVAEDVACERRVKALPPYNGTDLCQGNSHAPEENRAHQNWRPSKPVDEAAILRTIARIKAAPHEYPGAKSLIAIGELMIERGRRQ